VGNVSCQSRDGIALRNFNPLERVYVLSDVSNCKVELKASVRPPHCSACVYDVCTSILMSISLLYQNISSEQMRVLLATETCIWINQEQSKKARSLQFGDEAQSLVCSHHNAFNWFIVLTHAAAAG